MSIESFLRTVLVIAVAGVECASASRTGYIVDCVSANSIQSYFAYHNNETPYSQTKPDAAVAINPSSGLNAYNSDISVPGLGRSLQVNGKLDWRCLAGGDRFLYADYSQATTQAPFAQYLVRHQCQPVSGGGQFQVKLQYAIGCDGVIDKRKRAFCDSVTPSLNMFYTIYDADMSTVICTDVVEMSPNSGNWIGHETVSDRCSTSVYIQDLDYKGMFGGGSWDASVKTVAANGEEVQCGLIHNDGKVKEVI